VILASLAKMAVSAGDYWLNGNPIPWAHPRNPLPNGNHLTSNLMANRNWQSSRWMLPLENL
jgi:hypothetical protein